MITRSPGELVNHEVYVTNHGDAAGTVFVHAALGTRNLIGLWETEPGTEKKIGPVVVMPRERKLALVRLLVPFGVPFRVYDSKAWLVDAATGKALDVKAYTIDEIEIVAG